MLAVLSAPASALGETSLVWTFNNNSHECHPDCGFDLWRMNADGTDARITGSSPTGNALAADWTPRGDRLVYVRAIRGLNERLEIWLANADLSGDRALVPGLPGVGVDPEWSPDGRFVVFSLFPEGRGPGRDADLYVVRADGTELRQVTTIPGVEQEPSFSPDGSRLLFVHVAPGEGLRAGEPTVRSVDLEGGSLRDHTRGNVAATLSNTTFSPDGRSILFTSDRVLLVPTDGGAVRAIGPELSTQPRFSPDGRFVSYVRVDPGLRLSFWSAPVDAGESGAVLLRAPFRQGYGIDGPDWISDGLGPLPEAVDRAPPTVTLARMIEPRGRRGEQTIIGPSTAGRRGPRRIVVERGRDLRFLAVDRAGLRRLAVSVARRLPRGRKRAAAAAGAQPVRTVRDWRRIVGRLQRGSHWLTFRTADARGNRATARPLRVVVRRGPPRR